MASFSSPVSMREVGDEFRRILDRLARTQEQIAQVTATLVGLQGRLLATSRGGQHPLLGRALAQLQQAVQRLSEAAAANTAASEAVLGYLTHIGVGAGGDGSPIAEAPAAAADPPAQTRLDDQIKQARESLSPGVRGAQTHGKWMNQHGETEDLRSGKDDEWHQKAKAFAATLPAHLKAAARLAVHLETKFAVRMREEGRRREMIVIDREVCGRGPTDQRLPFTCDKQLRHFLPPGAELTVVEYDGTRRTYRGDPG